MLVNPSRCKDFNYVVRVVNHAEEKVPFRYFLRERANVCTLYLHPGFTTLRLCLNYFSNKRFYLTNLRLLASISLNAIAIICVPKGLRAE